MSKEKDEVRASAFETWLKDSKLDKITPLDGHARRSFDAGAAWAEGEWVAVSERLPTESGWYLTSTEHRVARMEFHLQDGFYSYAKILAWMPLPQPYARESK